MWLRVATTWHRRPRVSTRVRVVVMDISTTRRAEAALLRARPIPLSAQALPDAVYTVATARANGQLLNHDTFFGYTRAQLLADNAIISVAHPPTPRRCWPMGTDHER